MEDYALELESILSSDEEVDIVGNAEADDGSSSEVEVVAEKRKSESPRLIVLGSSFPDRQVSREVPVQPGPMVVHRTWSRTIGVPQTCRRSGVSELPIHIRNLAREGSYNFRCCPDPFHFGSLGTTYRGGL